MVGTTIEENFGRFFMSVWLWTDSVNNKVAAMVAVALVIEWVV